MIKTKTLTQQDRQREFFKSMENRQKLKDKCEELLTSPNFSIYEIEIFSDDEPNVIEFCIIRAIRCSEGYYELIDFECPEPNANCIEEWHTKISKEKVDKIATNLSLDVMYLLKEPFLNSLNNSISFNPFKLYEEHLL